jgi:hypothetical protein
VVDGETDDPDDSRSPALSIFDPATERWRGIGGPEVFRPSALALADGSILVFGDDEGGSHLREWVAARDAWVDPAQLLQSRIRSQMTLLHDGRVLVAGGVELISQAVDGGYSVDEGKPLSTTEIYDPGTDTWTPGPKTLAPRQGGVAVTLADDSVLMFGGYEQMPAPQKGGGDTGDPGPCAEPLATTERLVLRG